MKTSIKLQKEVADKIQESAEKIYWSKSQIINILLAYSLGLQYPQSIIKEIIWEQKQPQKNQPDCDKKIKRMQKIMDDREASADETIEEKDKTIWQLELKIYNLENELEEQKENKPKDTSKEWYKLWIIALYKSIYYRQELVKYDDDAVLARNLWYDIKLFKSYFWVEPDRKNLDDLDKLVDHYLTYKKNR